MSNAENAVLATARAMYGKRLRYSDFEHMLSLKTTDEIAAYLRSSTSYSDGFEGITSGAFTTASLEHVVNRSMFNKVAKLCKLEYIIGQSFYKYFIIKMEIEQILRCVSYLLIGEKDGYLLDFCSSIEREMEIDLYKMAQADSLQQLSEILKNTRYGRIIERCLNSAEQNYLNYESAFNSYFAKCSVKLAESAGHSKQKKAIYECISHHSDIHFMELLARTLLYYQDSVAVKSVVLPGEMTLFSKKEINALLSCENIEQMDEVLSKTVYRNITPLKNREDIKGWLNRYLACYYSKQIRFSSCPAVIMYCYMCRLKIEGSDVIKIIEGKKYGINPERLSSCICCADMIKEKEGD
mgnify:CR=1 FL=1